MGILRALPFRFLLLSTVAYDQRSPRETWIIRIGACVIVVLLAAVIGIGVYLWDRARSRLPTFPAELVVDATEVPANGNFRFYIKEILFTDEFPQPTGRMISGFGGRAVEYGTEWKCATHLYRLTHVHAVIEDGQTLRVIQTIDQDFDRPPGSCRVTLKPGLSESRVEMRAL